MDLENHGLERSGVSLHYGLGGDAGRPLVVLTHGATVDHHEGDTTAGVVGERYRVLMGDVRGLRGDPRGPAFPESGRAGSVPRGADALPGGKGPLRPRPA